MHCQVLHALSACTTLWLSRAVLCACGHGAMHLHCQVLHAWSACTALWLLRAVLRACWHGVMHLHCQVLHALNACTALWLSRAVLCACWHGAMHLHCQVLHAWCACTALWLPGAVLCAYWHGMHLHCQVLHAWNEFTALWLRRARFSIALRSMHSVMHGRHYCSLCERCPVPPGTMQSCHALHSKACVMWCIHNTVAPLREQCCGPPGKGQCFQHNSYRHALTVVLSANSAMRLHAQRNALKH